jgi:hypothetical protein
MLKFGLRDSDSSLGMRCLQGLKATQKKKKKQKKGFLVFKKKFKVDNQCVIAGSPKGKINYYHKLALSIYLCFYKHSNNVFI